MSWAVGQRDPRGQDFVYLHMVQSVGLGLQKSDTRTRGHVNLIVLNVSAEIHDRLYAFKLPFRRQRWIENFDVVIRRNRLQHVLAPGAGDLGLRMRQVEDVETAHG